MNQIKNIYGFIAGVAVLSLIACGRGDGLEAKKAQIEEKKMAMANLENEISQLEAEIAELDTNEVEETVELGVLVSVKDLQPESFNHKVEVNGVIQAEQIANVSPEMGGQIISMNVREGDNVTKGQTLAQLNTSVLQSSLSELDNAIGLATTVFERQSRLWEQKIGSEIQYLEAKNNLENLEKKKATVQIQIAMGTIKAPFNGTVDRVWQKAGELAAPGVPLVTVVDLSKMKVLADVSERYAAVVKKNSMVDVHFPSFGLDLQAPIKTVGSVINPGNRSFSVEVSVSNSDKTLKPNGVATIMIEDFGADSALVVPAIVLGKDQKGSFLYLVKSESDTLRASKTYVSTGMTSGGQTMVTSGLTAGDNVVISGYNEIANGDIVRIQ